MLFDLSRLVSDVSSIALRSINLTSAHNARFAGVEIPSASPRLTIRPNLACPCALAARQILRGRREQRLEAKRMTTRRFVGQENVSALLSKRSEVCWINCGIERRV